MDTAEVLTEIRAARTEQRDDHAALTKKVDDGFAATTSALTAHTLEDARAFGVIDKRLERVESLRSTLRWFGATIVAAALTGAAAEFFIHIGGKR